MNYKFSGFTQKLTGSATPAAHSPQGLKPGLPAESPTMIFATPTKVVSEGAATVEYLGANKVPDLQKIFQTSDGVPIHLKRGVPDRLLYRTTMALTVGGVVYCLVALYIAAQPNKKCCLEISGPALTPQFSHSAKVLWPWEKSPGPRLWSETRLHLQSETSVSVSLKEIYMVE